MRFICLFVLLVTLNVTAVTYYVDFDSGNDTNDGQTTNAPLRTLPGTKNAAGTTWLNSTWSSGGTLISTGAKVPAGTIFKLKPGTTYSSADGGGYVEIDSTYYTESSSNSWTTFTADQAWASGQVVFDGNGFSIGAMASVVSVKINGVKWDGAVTDGILIKRGPGNGLKWTERSGPYAQTNAYVQYIRFETNGTSFASDSAGAGAGQLSMRYVYDATVRNCNFDGGSNFINGILFGDNHMAVVDATVSDCVAQWHKGDLVTDDSGIGFKGLNSQTTYSNCISRFNLKGFDLGEVLGDNRSISYTVLNSSAISNWYGIAMNCAGASAYTGQTDFRVINSISYGNLYHGGNFYDPPFNLYIVHSIFDKNGSTNLVNQRSSNVALGSGGASATNAMRVWIYNSILSEGFHTQIAELYNYTTNTIACDFDWNAYKTNSSSGFGYWCRWGAYGGTGKDYSFGVNGPGWTSGDWYTNRSHNTVGYNHSTDGHLNCDPNSIGSGASNISFPTFYDSSAYDYRPRTRISGTNLTARSWYTTAMGYDRNGVPRSSWIIGPYETSEPTAAQRGFVQ